MLEHIWGTAKIIHSLDPHSSHWKLKFSLNRPCSFQSSWLVHRLSILLRVSLLLCLTTLTHLIPRSNVSPSVKTFLTFLLLFQAQLVATFPVTPYHIVYIFASHGLLLTCELQHYELLTCKESVPNTWQGV